MDFCKAYNERTEDQRGTIIPVEITIFEDRSFTFITKTPPTSVLLRTAAGLEKAAENPGREEVGSITDAQLTEIAEIKLPDLTANDLARPRRSWPAPPGPWGSRRPRRPIQSPACGRTSPGPVPNPTHEREPSWRKARSTRTRLVGSTGSGSTPPPRRLALVKSLAPADFDESVEVAVRLGVDPRKADEMIRGTVALPSGTGRDVRVAVFAAGEAAAAAQAAGADIVGSDDLAATVEAGTIEFDVAIATPDMMPVLGRLGRVLGPRGLMPNPKTGTVTDDVAAAVEAFKGGKVEYRTDRHGNVHVLGGQGRPSPRRPCWRTSSPWPTS